MRPGQRAETRPEVVSTRRVLDCSGSEMTPSPRTGQWKCVRGRACQPATRENSACPSELARERGRGLLEGQSSIPVGGLCGGTDGRWAEKERTKPASCVGEGGVSFVPSTKNEPGFSSVCIFPSSPTSRYRCVTYQQRRRSALCQNTAKVGPRTPWLVGSRCNII
ncbi:hypothetical protein B0T26DRAFT_186485 [Lasiosphaeria miniovina]|uniref:Uncharacterized protein n=1 Tax=Lasiosphaeria miniovina TaxID=1954250 RepID=A0AA40E5E4_9PEZI|nr:uncharacterized protein B0T26DRAFT_186485 [Lasiosphaeria miniovina]KAK0728854.1 hypothetical protein B0T26DRAFT_186485 [Lasiosphaeria miniovina]